VAETTMVWALKEKAGKFARAQRLGISLQLEMVGGYCCYEKKSISIRKRGHSDVASCF
jgi:hypothetical protein